MHSSGSNRTGATLEPLRDLEYPLWWQRAFEPDDLILEPFNRLHTRLQVQALGYGNHLIGAI